VAYDPYASVDPTDESAIDSPHKMKASPKKPPFSTKLPAGLGRWRGLCLGLGLGAVMATILPRLQPKPSAAPAKANVAAPAGQSVSVASVKSEALSETILTQGTVDSSDWIAVFPKATGVQIKEIRVKEGDRVESGQVIAILDNSVQQDRLAQADSQIRSATAQVESANAQLTAAEAQVVSAKAQAQSIGAVVEQRQAKLEQRQHNLEKAVADLKRYEDLAASGAIAAKDLDTYRNLKATAQDDVNVAKADLAQAEADVIKAESDVVKVESDREKVRADGVRATSDKQANTDNRNALSTQAGQAQLVIAPASGVLSQ
jgi:HlyD family secretion protein